MIHSISSLKGVWSVLRGRQGLKHSWSFILYMTWLHDGVTFHSPFRSVLDSKGLEER